MYLREPEYKPYIRARAISYEEVETPDEMLLAEISNFVLQDEEDRENLLNSMKESGDRLLLLRNTVQENRLVGVARLRLIWRRMSCLPFWDRSVWQIRCAAIPTVRFF